MKAPALNWAIDDAKQDIVASEIYISDAVKPKTKRHIEKMYDVFGHEAGFGRSDDMPLLGLTASPVSTLLKKLVQMGIIEPVAGYGKGKYRFKIRKD